MSLLHFHESAEHGHGHGTAVEALDPRVKLLLALGVAVWIGLLPAGAEVALVFLVVALLVIGALAQLPPLGLVVRAAAALPFVLVPAVGGLLAGTADPARLAGMAGRGMAAALTAALLVGIARPADLLAGAARLGVPDLLVGQTALLLRYLDVLRGRTAALVASARARGWGPGAPRRVASGGAMLGAMLLRSLDRADRVHAAMAARGGSGSFRSARPLRMRPADWIALGVGLGGLAGSLARLR